MLIIKKIGISGLVKFKPSVLPIEKGKVTYLYGKNMLKHGNGNAAGKSVFASSPADIFYDVPIVGERADKLKAGVRMIEFVRGGKTVTVKLGYAGKTERLKIDVDGKVRKGATPTKTRSLLKKLWPITEDEYRTYGYLDAKIPHPLVMGTTAQRKAFFTSFFQLDLLDAERKVLAAYNAELKKVRARFNELNTTFLSVKGDMLTKTVRLELEAEVEKLGARLKKLRQSSDKAQKVQSLLSFETHTKDSRRALFKLITSLDELTDELVASYSKRLKRAEASIEQMQDWKRYRQDLKEWQEKTADLDMTVPLEELETQSQAFEQATAELRLLKDLVDPRLTAPNTKDVAKPETSKDALVELRAKIRHQQEHARKFSRGVCDECGQPVEKPDPAKLERLVAKEQELTAEWRRYDKWADAKKELDAEVAAYEPKAEQRAKAEKRQAKNRDAHVLFQKRSRIIKPNKVERPDEPEEVEPLRQALVTLAWGRQNRDQIESLLALTEEDRALTFDGQKLEQLQDKMGAANTRLQVHNTVKGRAAEMKARLADLESQLGEEEALLLALEAYGDRAIKKQVVEAISDQMMTTVNRLSSLVFENYRFEFVWDSQIRLLVHRPVGTSDVRKLSGSESMLFTVILVFSLMMFVPSHKRLSLLILDEPCASFHEDTIRQFHTLLPHLSQLIPSILVVSPKEYERYEGAKEYTIYRDQSGASIKRGHPSELH